MGGDLKAGPIITDNGNFILDTDFGEIFEPAQLEMDLIKIPGVIEVGLFCGKVEKVFLGMENGEVQILEPTI